MTELETLYSENARLQETVRKTGQALHSTTEALRQETKKVKALEERVQETDVDLHNLHRRHQAMKARLFGYTFGRPAVAMNYGNSPMPEPVGVFECPFATKWFEPPKSFRWDAWYNTLCQEGFPKDRWDCFVRAVACWMRQEGFTWR